ncbi:ATP-binding protein [Mucilaginibacter rubeus]|uniref:ATP-binding protein n=1 Tax=Mucilaginibacter rubeus TaxID=2027860 RepID=A0AAE6JIB2_9SPHI|nr:MULTISPECIES: ATP-binding protein [Mucilaginibacter]QEM06312.1 ATP-binding protein [Mucilaginibacter rubeus]QEM18894.1 ATP-binding protein [Mucilaginibacter gossypii]QTE44562.1 ATP-binding protein [Mucilaginibacter rubeus]QTE51160.1 ATP-binding protein [Mucilaginibacter rubeus]QTE56248.1 ATP-binding protein [Mucilaginibacter rubeus]
MALGDAHQGYSYQDLLCCYYILDDVVKFNISDFYIDVKEYKEDRFDDFTILHSDAVYKKQVKYSNEQNNHTLTKNDLANDGNYQLALFSLYSSWISSIKPKTYVRLCLAWNSPDANLTDLMDELLMEGSFSGFQTRVFQFNIDKFWPAAGTPPQGWNKFKQQQIDRQKFSEFLTYLTIELELPKFSEDLYQPGPLEKLVLDKVEGLGIGYFPNDHYKKQEFAAALLAKVRKHRSSGVAFTTADFYDNFSIKTDYGAIQQVFPINENQKIETVSIYDQLILELKAHQRISLTGEPGMGKSWLVENFKKYVTGTEIHLIRHLCYTDLNDQFQKERIQINVFYANLIKEILDIFPKLKDSKAKVYASDLEELNLLLSAIDEETILVIDGIDHIERIYQFRNLSVDLKRSEIDILHAINKLTPSPFVKILSISQPITELVELDHFHSILIPRWAHSEIERYLNKCGIEDQLVADDQKLSQYLDQKVCGNPLYLRYIVEEIQNLESIDLEHLQQIPHYDAGLKGYYQYLLSKLSLKEQIPRILSGINFSVTTNELQEITGEGKLVEKSLETLRPVIKLNVSQNGYSIYHESFRRYIIDQLIKNQISLERTVYNPIISWFEEKGVFEYSKSYRFYFQYIHESGKSEKALSFATIDFVWKSAFHGHHWEVIDANLKYINKAVLNHGTIPQLFISTELSRVISMTEDAFNETLLSYLKAVGNLEGYQKVADYLVYEGTPTLGFELGLKACQLCFLNNMKAPWQIYLDYYRGTKIDITPEMFALILACILWR